MQFELSIIIHSIALHSTVDRMFNVRLILQNSTEIIQNGT